MFGIIFQLFIKDSLWPSSFIFYFTPFNLLLVISILFFVFAIFFKINRVAATIYLIFIISLLLFNRSGFIENDLEADLICWNVARQKTSSLDILKFVDKNPADSYVFIEYERGISKEGLPDLLNEYNFINLPGNKVIYTKIDSHEIIKSFSKGKNNFNIVRMGDKVYLIADVESWPFYNRKRPFEMLYSLLDEYDVDIICGDFNTPYDSVYFDKLREKFNCGITENIYGRSTWPTFFPFASIDHIFISKKYKIKSYDVIDNKLTDHFPLKINFD